MQNIAIASIAHVIQLAVAPVFLLTGIGGMLGVMTSRLARIVDRARAVEGMNSEDAAEQDKTRCELDRLSRRAKLISVSISLCTMTALLVSAVIAILFLAAFLGYDASVAVALLFIAAMLIFIIALVYFLREIQLAINGLSIGLR